MDIDPRALLSNVIRMLIALGDSVPGSYAERICVVSLYCDGDAPMSALGKRIAMSRGAMTTIIDRLERRGIVERHLSREDRRIILVRLAPEGTAAIESAIESLED